MEELTSAAFLGSRRLPAHVGALVPLVMGAISPDLALASRRCTLHAPVATEQCPASLLERFAGNAAQALLRLLVFLSPVTVRAITVREDR